VDQELDDVQSPPGWSLEDHDTDCMSTPVASGSRRYRSGHAISVNQMQNSDIPPNPEEFADSKAEFKPLMNNSARMANGITLPLCNVLGKRARTVLSHRI
jgi:hypothetical protein